MQSRNVSKTALWSGRILSAIPILLLLMTSSMSLTRNPKAVEGLRKYGYPDNALIGIGAAELGCTIIYMIPQTAVLGAILLTGYLGGATATHVHAGEPFIMPVVTGVIIWLGVFLRDSRLRALVPFRR